MMKTPTPPKLLAQNLRTVMQAAEEYPAFPVSAFRTWIFYLPDGFEKVVVKVGRRVLIDVDAFGRWLDAQRLDRAS